MAKILITGATGFVGKNLVAKLLEKGHQVTAVTRDAAKAKEIFRDKIKILQWDIIGSDVRPNLADDIDCVVNLMGENLSSKRWSLAQKKKIETSRILGTRKLVDALKIARVSLKTFISSSAIGYYPVNRESFMDEMTSPKNSTSFLGELCYKWEGEGLKAPSQRIVLLRIGVVLGRGGGLLAKLSPIFSLGLGGKIGSGNQMMSWIHIHDLVNIFVQAVEDERMSGPINATAPNPTSNALFSKTLAKSLSRPCLFPVPSFAIKAMMGEMSTLALDGQEIVPKKLQDLGFPFQFENIEKALGNLYNSDR